MSSLELVEFINADRKERGDNTELAHSDFLKKVAAVIKDARSFSSIYFDSMNREKPCYKFPKREACLLAMSYSYELQAKVFDRMTEMEAKQAHQIPQTFSAALRLAGELQEKVESLQLEAKENAPKVEFAMAVRNLDGSCELGQFSALIGIGRNTFFKQLRADKILMISNRPYQEYKDRGLLIEIESLPYTDLQGKSHPTFKTMVTGRGQIWLEKKYRIAV